MNITTPYADLDPNLIINAIEDLGFSCTASLLALNSYENRVYQIGIENSAPLIAKFYRPHRWTDECILEEHQFALELAALEIPVVPPLVSAENKTLHHYQNFRFALFPRKGGRPLELENLEQLKWMGRFIGRLHAASSLRPFKHRLMLNPQTYGYEPFQFLMKNNLIPDYLKEKYIHVIGRILAQIDQLFNSIAYTSLRLHGDMHPGNILWNEGPHIVDLDDCLQGPAIQDLWMLLSGDKSQVQLQFDYILEGYSEFHDFNYRELHLIEALRSLRLIHYCAWLAKRWDDPSFPRNFPWFNTSRYWEEQLNDFNEQAMLLENKLENL